MLLSLLLTLISLDESLQPQTRTHLTRTAAEVVKRLDARPAAPKDRMQEQFELTKSKLKSIEESNRKLELQLRESQKLLEEFKKKRAG